MPETSAQDVRTCSARKLTLFRLIAVLLVLLPLLIVEGALRAWGVGVPKSEDPFVGFEGARRLFQRSGDELQIAPERLKFFAPDHFDSVKPADEYRIFCLGGSTVQGRPYSKETSFTTWLELALQQVDQSRSWNVINCGGISYASYRLVPILNECLTYQPDLIVVCTGHNEFLEDRTYANIKGTPRWIRTLGRAARQVRMINVVRESFTEEQKTETLPTEVEAILDYEDGLAAFHRDDERAEMVREHFESSLMRMKQQCLDHRVPLIFVQPPSNLAGTPPFKSSLEDISRDEIQSMLAGSANLEQAKAQLEQASQQFPRNALLAFELGQCYAHLLQMQTAKTAFIRARDEDLCPLRMTSPLERTLHQVADENAFLDAHALLESQTESGVLGDFWLVDHVHPSFSGHQLIALQLVRLLEEQGVINLSKDWEQAASIRFEEHFSSLDPAYFHRGQRMLSALKEWTQGRADGQHVKTRYPHLLPDKR